MSDHGIVVEPEITNLCSYYRILLVYSTVIQFHQTKRFKVSAWVKTNHASSNAQLKAFTFLKNGGGANSPYYFNPTYSSGTANLETVSICNTNNKWVYIELEIDIPTSVPPGDVSAISLM